MEEKIRHIIFSYYKHILGDMPLFYREYENKTAFELVKDLLRSHDRQRGMLQSYIEENKQLREVIERYVDGHN